MRKRKEGETTKQYHQALAYEAHLDKMRLKGKVVSSHGGKSRANQRALTFKKTRDLLISKIDDAIQFGDALDITHDDFLYVKQQFKQFKDVTSRNDLATMLNDITSVIKSNLPKVKEND